MNPQQIEQLKQSLATIFAESIKLSKTQKDDQIAGQIIEALNSADLSGSFDKQAFIDAIIDLAEIGAAQTESPIDDIIVKAADQILDGEGSIFGMIFKGIGARIKERRAARKEKKAEKRARKNK